MSVGGGTSLAQNPGKLARLERISDGNILLVTRKKAIALVRV